MAASQYQREDNGRRFTLGSINTVRSVDLLGPNEYAYLANVRAYLKDRITGRATQTAPAATTSGIVHSIRRLNDTTPLGPPAGYVLVIGAAGVMYVNSTSIATGFSTHPVSLIPFRPNTSVQPWMYVGDSSQTAHIITPPFDCAGMIKVRSDGLTRKWGVAEPQAAPTVSFPGGGNGPSQLFYNYVYRASETGALSNPSPVSIPGTNSQANPTETIPATSHANFVFNGTQYEFNGSQIRTTGSVGSGVTTDFVSVNNMGFAIPTGVNIDGIQVDLNWIGQNSGTGVLTTASLFYLGSTYGNAKFPGIQNQSFSSDTLQGGNGDVWGATLTPEIINDPTFGFGVQITTQLAGGSDRSFINSMAITVFYSTQNANITPTPSSDPQVDKIDFYRQGGGLANPTYVGTGPNSATVFNDVLSDLAAATNPILQLDNFEPFPSIDIPRKGVVNITGQVLTVVSGDNFNIRWLPGTVIEVGSPQVAYSAVRRPSSTTSWNFVNNDPNVKPIPDGTNLVWNIAEPILAAQPLPSLWGPTDNTAYMFGVYDPLRPGTLYFTKGNNPDSAPDTNQIEVTSPSEPLMNGVIVNGIGMVFSTQRAWLIYPTFTTALATVQGIQGQVFNLQESITNRGLFIRTAICTEAGKNVFFRGKDGIYVSPGGNGSQCITDDQIFNLFPHEGYVPSPITRGGFTIYPPDDSQPEAQRLSFMAGYLYYDYLSVDGIQQTLVYDVAAKGWSVDVYGTLVSVHALEEGQGANSTLIGCIDGSVRRLQNGATEAATSVVATGAINFGDARGFQRIGDIFLRAFINLIAPISLAMFTEQYLTPVSGFAPTSLTGIGTLDSTIIDFSNGLAKDINDLETVYSWQTSSTNYLDLWQPSWIELPETTQDRPTDYSNINDDGNKFFQGLILELDTLGLPKTFSVEDEFGTFHTPVECPVTTSGQTMRSFTFSPPFVSHMVRIVTNDGVGWRLFPTGDGIGKWLVQPYPESSTVWTTETSSFGMNGWIHCFQINLAYICSSPVVVTLNTDQGSFVVNFPAAGSGLNPNKILQKVVRNKWKVCSFTVTSTAPITLWKDLCEVWLKPWDAQTAYSKAPIFGGDTTAEAQI